MANAAISPLVRIPLVLTYTTNVGQFMGRIPPLVRNVITLVVLGAVVAVSGLYAAASYPASRSFSSPVGHRFGEDGVKECLVVPPLPPIPSVTPCRYYPVWVVALSNPACDIIVAINAYTHRFAGGGTSNSGTEHAGPPVMCELAPESRTANWWQPTWS